MVIQDNTAWLKNVTTKKTEFLVNINIQLPIITTIVFKV